jgi:branched-chain amino acid aminotransferase
MPNPKPRYLSFNGQIVPYADAKIHILSPAAKYGAGVFEGIRGYWTQQDGEIHLFRMREHLHRLHYSMKVMRFVEDLDDMVLTRALVDLIRANEFREDIHIRLSVWVDGDGEMDATGPIGWSIAALPRPTTSRVREGVHAAVSSWERISDNAMPARVKCNANYNNSRLAAMQGRLDGYDAILFLTRNGHIAESSGACFFMVRNGRPVTPSVTSSILESITRETMMQVLSESFLFSTTERDIDRTEVYGAEEAFLCGSGQEITPILSLDRLPIGDGKVGPLTAKLQQRYFAIVRGETDDHAEWRTPVYRSN